MLAPRLARYAMRFREAGVAGQDLATVRRIRTINLVALTGCTITFAYCIFYAIYDARLFAYEIGFLMAVGVLYPTVILANRANRVEAAMWLLAAIALVHISVLSWLLGPSGGSQVFLLALPFIVSLLIRDGDRITIWPVALVSGTIFFFVSANERDSTLESLPDLTQQIYFASNVFGVLAIASGISLFFRWSIERAEAALNAERERADRLLRAILPEPVAETLKQDDPGVVAERFAAATVLFADIVGFTERSARIDASEIVADLNRLFSRVDMLAESRGVEKIKTIGDAYFAVCGLPNPVPDHAARIADFALDLEFMAKEVAKAEWPGLRFRIVINTGPVVAGVIGRTKFAYDVWGDTVNTAARMEDICSPGEILLSEAARAALPPRFETESRGVADLRNKGSIAIHRLVGRSTGPLRTGP